MPGLSNPMKHAILLKQAPGSAYGAGNGTVGASVILSFTIYPSLRAELSTVTALATCRGYRQAVGRRKFQNLHYPWRGDLHHSQLSRTMSSSGWEGPKFSASKFPDFFTGNVPTLSAFIGGTDKWNLTQLLLVQMDNAFSLAEGDTTNPNKSKKQI